MRKALLAAAVLAMTATPGFAQNYKFVIVPKAMNNPFFDFARDGCEKRAKELGNIECIYKGPVEHEPATQAQIIQDFITQKVDGLAISVADVAAMTKSIEAATAAGIAVITFDSDAPGSKRIAYIGTDNVAAGRQAGEEIKKALPNGGKIALFVGTMDADNARERVQGIKESIAGTKVELVDVFTDQVDFAKAKANMENVLVKYPDIALLSGLWSYETPLIYDAVKAAGKAGKVKIVGFDEDQRTLRGISDGTIESTVVQQPYEFGYLSATNIIKTLNGDKSWIPKDSKLIVPTKVISKANVAEFAANLKDLLKK